MRKFIIPTFHLLVILSVSSCGLSSWEKNIESPEEFLDAFEKEIELTSEVFLMDTTHLLKPFNLMIFDKYMVINDKTDSTIFSIYDLDTRHFIKRFLRRGRGPNEFLTPYLASYSNDTVMMLDRLTSRASLFSLKTLLSGSPVADKMVTLEKANKSDGVEKAFVVQNHILTTGQFKQGRYQTFKKNGQLLSSFGEYPNVSSKVEYDNYHLGYIFGGNEEIRPNTDFSRLACLQKNSLEIFALHGVEKNFTRQFNVQWQTDHIMTAKYEQGKPYVVRTGNGVCVGAGNLAVTEKYIFFPYSRDEFLQLERKGIRDYFDYVLVMDWEGNPVAKLLLDKRIQFPLEISPDGKFLYSTHVDVDTGFAQIIRFDISSI